jgi:hypothetical protein
MRGSIVNTRKLHCSIIDTRANPSIAQDTSCVVLANVCQGPKHNMTLLFVSLRALGHVKVVPQSSLKWWHGQNPSSNYYMRTNLDDKVSNSVNRRHWLTRVLKWL